MNQSRRAEAFKVAPVAGQKRAAPALLPAFEPFSSPSNLPRVRHQLDAYSSKKGPEPKLTGGNYLPSAPSSSTFAPTSSPPRDAAAAATAASRRSTLHRTLSAVSERAPLAALSSIELDGRGEPTLMGRSSNSSHYQLSTNKLISRVHVRAAFLAAEGTNPKRIQVECTGWNGVKVHCQGRAWELFKGDTFTSETEDVDILVDVQDARVLVKWPRPRAAVLTPSDSEGGAWDSDSSPSRRVGVDQESRHANAPLNQRSPLERQHRLQWHVSPTPRSGLQSHVPSSPLSDANLVSSQAVQIYEDVDESFDESGAKAETQPTQSTQIISQPLSAQLKASMTTDADSFSDNDEENDPIITSFGPQGDDLDGRLQSFTAGTPSQPRRPLKSLPGEILSPRRQAVSVSASPTKRARTNDRPILSIQSPSTSPAALKGPIDQGLPTFLINHLVYSHLSATPLSMLFQDVQQSHEIKHNARSMSSSIDGDHESPLTSCSSLERLLRSIPCIGAVQREGKDAAGKRLESEFYYVPEKDDDVSRIAMVQDLGIAGRGLRQCRKSHKQYYWRKPK